VVWKIVQNYFIKIDNQGFSLLNIYRCFQTQPSSPMKFMTLFRLVLLVTPLSLSPAAESLPEFSSGAIFLPGEAGAAGLPRLVVQPVPEPSSWALLTGTIGCFLLVRRRY
jgi:hypothetical protein